MASATGEEPASLPTAANAPAVATDDKLMVATGRGDCQQLKDLLNKQDATTMVMTSSNQASAAEPTPASINPLLLASACSGYWEGLNFLLNREDAADLELPFMIESQRFRYLLAAYISGNSSNGSLAMQQASDDIEAFLKQTAPSAESLLKGVTVEGDTALHAVATYGDEDDFLISADIVFSKKIDLLFVQNNKGDTPLHCAARAGNSRMVSELIGLAKGKDSSVNRVKELLETENKLKETALHEAVRIGNNDMAKLLMEEDSELASFPKDGTSPLYLAILLEKEIIAQKLYNMSDGKLSYSGPNGQNALHAAVLRGTGLTTKLLEWNKALTTNKDLTTQRDENGSTPLHFAAALQRQDWRGSVCRQLLEANPAALYQSDHDGLFPIHVAASVNATGAVAIFLKKSPSCAGLRDAMGRTFLQVAVEKSSVSTVFFAFRNRSVTRILNMQDDDGNTALHLAVQSGKLLMFCAIFGNRQVHLNLTNRKGQTPLDISRYKIPRGIYYVQNSEKRIKRALEFAGARKGVCRQDHFVENCKDMHKLKSEDEGKESEKMKDTTQTFCIGSVLITTVTFGATFALPGGYKADDHPNGGSPTLAGRWVFDAFMMANTLAFILSSIATFGLVYAGSPLVNLSNRRFYLIACSYFMATSITSMTGAFALGAYIVLSPVAHKTAAAICVMSSLVLLSRKIEFWLKTLLLASLCLARGSIWVVLYLASVVLVDTLLTFWPLILAFGWAAPRRNHPVLRMEPPVQPPTPLA